MTEQFIRTERLLGKDAMKKIYESHVAVFGIGGVGGSVVEALTRCGVGKFDLIDADEISISNLNRQIIATMKTIGMAKTEAMKQRISDINPDASVTVHKCFFLPENADQIDFSRFDYVVDAVDTVTAKLEIIVRSREQNIPVISCMGTGNKLDPTRLEVADIYSTSVCPLAKVMRRELKKRNIDKLKVVYSKEEPIKPEDDISMEADTSGFGKKRSVPGSVSFVPPAAGLIIAAEVIRELTL